MKTSNKLLLVIGASLLSSIFISAFGLRSKLMRGDYSAASFSQTASTVEMDMMVLNPGVSKVALKGSLSSVNVHVKYDTASYIEMTKDLPILVRQEGETLFISNNDAIPNNFDSLFLLSNQVGNIHIYLDQFKELTNEGATHTSTISTRTGTSSTLVHFGFKVAVEGFQQDSLHVQMRKAGTVNFHAVDVGFIDLNMDGNTVAKVDSTSRLGHLYFSGRERAKLTLERADIQRLRTNLQNHAEISLKGTNLN